MKRILLIALLMMSACQSQQLQPVDIEAGDICSRCKMAISEKRYAAEVIAADGGVFKFDDIGCFIRLVGERELKEKAAAYFAVDFESGEWLDARQSVYLKSEAIPSPMASGLLAVKDRSRAVELSGKFQGQILMFEELWTSTR